MNTPNVLFADMETTPILATLWGLGRQDVGYKQIYKEREIACIGYAWNDRPARMLGMDYRMFDLHVRDDGADYEMVKEFVQIASRADIIIGHNIQSFDIGVLRARIIRYGLPDIPRGLPVDDTYTSIKDVGFLSHKLDYLLGYVGEEPKLDHPYEMWLDVINHRGHAFRDMKMYCKGDVDKTRTMYYRLKPYVQSNLNLAVYHGDSSMCPNCGAHDSLVKRGYRYTLTNKFPRFYCKACNTYPSLGKGSIKRSSEFPR